MKTSINANNSVSNNQISQKLNQLYSEILQKLQVQILQLGNKFPSDDFTNDFLNELSKDQSKHTLTALCRVLINYDPVELFNNYPEEVIEIHKTLNNFNNLLHINDLFIQDESAVIKKLNNVSKCNN